MAVVDHHRIDATSQLLEFAERGRLIPPRINGVPTVSGLSPLPVVVAASTVIGLGMAICVSGIISGATVAIVMGIGAISAGIALLVPALNAVRHDHDTEHVVDIQPAAVIPPRRLKAGMWIEREGAWVRVDEAGVAQGGAITALLSTGDVIDLSHPVTVAGGPFRPVDVSAGPAR